MGARSGSAVARVAHSQFASSAAQPILKPAQPSPQQNGHIGALAAGSPPAAGAVDAALRRVRRVLAARSCSSQAAQLSACVGDGGAAAAAAGPCAQYADAFAFCRSVSAQPRQHHPGGGAF
ncbi:hypothetical protein Rsub_09338 [Raphidocelis subcapitata]|uniref:Uncharacterized protein n=1 Tax=Raphidocelis subcapitata TaxID=307507 RepID=A0A2V0PCC8_9CHLO|nr:hypothetical protein Rsub_09338 [Raphidocelis subcapitata]|eukprot:GBF96592.1 hypothetical protein Rsub_09338 [Raphidocelis subcapitata]